MGSVPVKVSAGTGLTVMVAGPVMVLAGLAESVAVTETVLVPAVVGVPVRLQSEPRVRPAGTVPAATLQWYGAVPPVTGMAPVYGVSTVAAGGETTVRLAGAAFTWTVIGPVV